MPSASSGRSLFLASRATAMVTGHVLAVDSGFLAHLWLEDEPG